VDVSGKVAYSAATVWKPATGFRGALHILDVSDPTNPALLGTYTTTAGYIGLAVSSQYAFLAEGIYNASSSDPVPNGLQVLDVSDPGNPVRIGQVAGINASSVAVSGNYAYVGVSASYDSQATSSTWQPVGNSRRKTPLLTSGDCWSSTSVTRAIRFNWPLTRSRVTAFLRVRAKIRSGLRCGIMA
jgi:hypothetical protein